MRQPFRAIACTLLLASVGACVSPPDSSTPLAASADPAVELANAKSTRPGSFREGYIGEGDDRIHYVEAGSGHTIIFVHGFPAFWYVWFDQMEAFRSCYRVIAIDAPGANLSAKPESTEYYRLSNLADRLDAVISRLAPGEKITLVGHDWGGTLAWSYAERDSSRLERLVVFSAPPHDMMMELLATNEDQRARSSYMERFRVLTLKDIQDGSIHQTMFEIGYRTMIDRGILDSAEGEVFQRAIADVSTLNAGMNWYRANIPAFDAVDPVRDAWPEFDALTAVPTLLVQGENDRTFVPALGDLASAHAPNLRSETIPGVGHWTQFEDPAAANRLLAEFVGAPAGCLTASDPKTP